MRPLARRRSAQRAFIASESRRRPAAVMPPLLFCGRVGVEILSLLEPPRRAQRARAAAESFARVAADMLRR